MKRLLFQDWALCALLNAFISITCQAADEEFSIPRIDGRPTLADFADMQPGTSLAKSMNKAENFVQREPYPGEPSAQHTEAYIGFDDENLYVFFLAFDENPELIRSNMAARENIGQDDHVGFMVDTFNNQRSAFAFYSNSRGIQLDMRWAEGSGRRAGFDSTFDAVWFSEGELTDQGYMVLITVPMKSLRFSESDEQLWRVQFNRQITRYGEQSFWPEYSINVEGRLNQAALMPGITNVSSGNNY